MTKLAVAGQKEFLAGWDAYKKDHESGRPNLEPPPGVAPAPKPKTTPSGRTRKGLATRKAKHGKTKLKKKTVKDMKERGDKVKE